MSDTMSLSVNSIQQQAKNYYDAIPQGTLKTAARSFVVSFAVSTVLTGGNVGVGALAGAIAVTATLVESLTTPIFKNLFDIKSELSWGQSILRTSITLISAAALAGAAGFPGLMSVVPQSVVLNAFLHLFMHENINQPTLYWCIFA